MNIKRSGHPTIIVTFKKKNGESWEETYSSYLIDLFKNNPEVIEIRNKDSNKIIYSQGNIH